ncbi:sarcosine oxidase subunit gamma [Planktotalea sp.]|uniref:sarcosine oxidase subunit gamma n=1 Tax=Planktotalea sp. TaxID=2029877 RepID=UPI003296BD26
MVELSAKTPADGLLPYEAADTVLSELALGRMTSIAPFKGRGSDVAKLLGSDLPKVARSSGKAGQEIVWFSQGQFMALGFDLPAKLVEMAALTDQSDAWCALELKGAASEDVLARLVPIDLRQSTFKRGHAARTLLGHMPLHITRTSNDGFRIFSFRSMAVTMVHEITRAMDLLQGRG